MCGCVIILVIVLVVQLYLLSCGRGFNRDYFVAKPNNPTRWVIDPITGMKMNANTVHSQDFWAAKKLAVPKSWDDNSRHVPLKYLK